MTQEFTPARRHFRGDLLKLEQTNPKKLRLTIIQEKGGVCYYCGGKGTKRDPLQLAHMGMLNYGSGNRKHLWLSRMGHPRNDVVPAHMSHNPHINPRAYKTERLMRQAHTRKMRALNKMRKERLRLK